MKKQLLTYLFCSMASLGIVMATSGPQDQATSQQPATQQPGTQEGSEHFHGRHQASPERQLAFMTKKLNLTADQQNQILPILTDRQQQVQSIRSDSSLAREDRAAKMKSLRADSRAKIEAVLTPEQKQAWEQMQRRGHERQAERQS